VVILVIWQQTYPRLRSIALQAAGSARWPTEMSYGWQPNTH
jgi:hypothetical protein